MVIHLWPSYRLFNDTALVTPPLTYGYLSDNGCNNAVGATLDNMVEYDETPSENWPQVPMHQPAREICLVPTRIFIQSAESIMSDVLDLHIALNVTGSSISNSAASAPKSCAIVSSLLAIT